jgi:hypothetical protein
MSELSGACHWVEDGKQCECIGTWGETQRPIAPEEIITSNGIRAKTGRKNEVTHDLSAMNIGGASKTARKT